jgi:sarcosine oxidase subunit alpha
VSEFLHRIGSREPALTITWDGHERVPARAGEMVTTALLCAGIVATSRSLKFRRPRGPWCMQGDCGTCLVRIDGRPNQRACLTRVRDGMRVDPQNRMTVGAGPDPTGLADKVFGEEMDHHHFMVRPRVLNEIMKGIARNLAGLGTLPDRVDDGIKQHRHHAPDVLVVGGGPAGRTVASTLREAGVRCVLVDRFPASVRAHVDDLQGTGVFGIYGEEGVVAAATLAVRGAETIHTITPRHLVYATGSRDSMIPLPNNDVPGVVSARGLAALCERDEVVPAGCVVVGQGVHADGLGKRLGAPVIAADEVVEIEGGKEVDGVALRARTVPCSLVALAPAASAASELARLGGAEVRWDGAGFVVERDAHGRVATHGPWIAWACGAVAGALDPAAAEEDARSIALTIAGGGP